MNTVLILGANGFIGRYLVEKLISNGYFVIGYGRTPSERTKWITGDFTKEERFKELLEENKVDTVIHLISSTVPSENTSLIPQEIEANIIPSVRLLEAMKDSRTKEILFLSSGGTVYGESTGVPSRTTDLLRPICSYGLQKKIIEDYLRFYSDRYGLRVKIARLSNPYGVPNLLGRGQGIIPIFIHKLLKREKITIYGNTTRDYIHIDDAVEGVFRLLEYSGEQTVFNFGSGEGISIEEIVRKIEMISQLSFREINRMPIRSCDVETNVLDVSETREILNWSTSIDLESGIRRTLNEMKESVFDDGLSI